MTDQNLLAAILRTDLVAFIQKTFATLTPNKTLFMNWHIRAIAYYLERVRRGELKRLIINVPPRSLKSIIGSVGFPAFVLGRDPTKRVLCVSYSQSLAIDHANMFRIVVNSPWYRRAWPSMRLSPIKNTETKTQTTQHGFRLATSVDGTLTGRGGDIIIIDDPLKADDANSKLKREAVNTWYANTLLSRLDNKQEGAIIVIMQRLHQDDLVGHLLRSDDEEWHQLILPAIAEVDDSIPLSYDHAHYRPVGDVLNPAMNRERFSITSNARSVLTCSRLSISKHLFRRAAR
ncbi:hypothetical protein GJW-30_1_04448 [Variibacter gotjawalensis]|uniref:Terminase-like family protein n=1 Tax=Variibacter gotjawalensis TaxID=1333996 RepID=A0A0S3Q159_9BRAD|nr:hypothetical protein [Variibacter gotjawalensis]NIK47732.1 hypothetical protein [Variibacter gotjawalensis]RZS49622.1 hypothetical protein EV661_2060 [Variibacter gotjawalensis]BAT61886.1 hypothetical protein GJW-30_1_04448 [Variibacter gotjawalensis]